jgi:hypothetical protein
MYSYQSSQYTSIVSDFAQSLIISHAIVTMMTLTQSSSQAQVSTVTSPMFAAGSTSAGLQV